MLDRVVFGRGGRDGRLLSRPYREHVDGPFANGFEVTQPSHPSDLAGHPVVPNEVLFFFCKFFIPIFYIALH